VILNPARSAVLLLLDQAVRDANGRPIVLNLYCCQGGSAAGYEAAGCFVLGVDKDPQPRYPYLFVQADALWFLAEFAEWISAHVLLVDASPPCQLYSRTWKINRRSHPDLIAPTRALIVATGRPYVIENVEEAAPELRDPVTMCGAMFPGLHTYRHRLIEAGGWTLVPPQHPRHQHDTVKMGRPLKSRAQYLAQGEDRDGDWYHAVGHFSNVPYVKADMGVGWMNRDGVSECIPPVYTEFIGRAFLASRAQEVAA
jgi:DNA (cytosine-5)-methyltransferase 1